MGRESRANLMLSVRGDGVIVKPDAPLVPTDASILADARHQHTPLIAATYTDHGIGRAGHTAYVFADARSGDSRAVSFSPASLGFIGPVYVYNYFDKTGRKFNAGDTFTDTLGPTGRAYYVIAPVGPSGIAFLGDAGKFVGTGKQRIFTLQDTPGGLTSKVVCAPGEAAVTLHGIASSAPIVSATGGTAGPVAYDMTTGHFRVTVSPTADAPVRRMGGDPARLMSVVLRTGK